MSRPGPQGGVPTSQPPQQPQVSRPTPPGYPQQPQFPGMYPLPYGQRYGPPAFPPGPGFPHMPYGAPPGWFPPGQGFPQGPGHFPPQFPLGPPGQQQTPQQQRPMAPGSGPVNAPKPTSELPVGEKPSSKPASRHATPGPATSAQVAPTPPVESKPSVAEAVQPPTGPAAQAAAAPVPAANTASPAGATRAPPTGPRSGRVQPAIPIASPSKPPVPAAVNQPLASATGNNAPQGNQQTAVTEATRAATAAVAAAMAKLPQPNVPKKPQQADATVESVTKKMSEVKPFEGQRPQRGGHQHPRGGRGAHRTQYQAHGKKIEVPQTDYDFESANAKFNKQDLLKEAIAGDPETEISAPNGDTQPTEVPPESSAASSSAYAGYNKSSSFFDNISSEARDREERLHGREWRGEEEKRNIETFGQGSVDGYRGRGRGRGRGYRGRGYGRGRGGFRGRGASSHSTGIPT